MKKHTIILFSLCLIVFSTFLPISANAHNTTLKTAVPANHTLHLSIDGNGTVSVNSIAYSKSKDISISRHSEPSIQIQAGNGYCIQSVVYNGEKITHLFRNGKWTMPNVESDVTLSVVFARSSGNPATGDSTHIQTSALIFMLSAISLAVCILKPRKKSV